MLEIPRYPRYPRFVCIAERGGNGNAAASGRNATASVPYRVAMAVGHGRRSVPFTSERYGERTERCGERTERYGERTERCGERTERYGERTERCGERTERYGERSLRVRNQIY